MVLPDWTTAINTQINAFLAWTALSQPMQIMIAVAVVSFTVYKVMESLHH